MRIIFLLIALWNTIMAFINMMVLPLFLSAEVMMLVTPVSQLLPIYIPLCIASMMPQEGEFFIHILRDFTKIKTHVKGEAYNER